MARAGTVDRGGNIEEIAELSINGLAIYQGRHIVVLSREVYSVRKNQSCRGLRKCEQSRIDQCSEAYH